MAPLLETRIQLEITLPLDLQAIATTELDDAEATKVSAGAIGNYGARERYDAAFLHTLLSFYRLSQESVSGHGQEETRRLLPEPTRSP